MIVRRRIRDFDRHGSRRQVSECQSVSRPPVLEAEIRKHRARHQRMQSLGTRTEDLAGLLFGVGKHQNARVHVGTQSPQDRARGSTSMIVHELLDELALITRTAGHEREERR